MIEINKEKKEFSSRIQIRIQTLNVESLKDIQNQVKDIAQQSGILYSSISLPLKIKKINLLKSPHVNKKARDEFEVRFYNRLLILYTETYSLDLFLLLKGLYREDSSVKVSLFLKKGNA